MQSIQFSIEHSFHCINADNNKSNTNYHGKWTATQTLIQFQNNNALHGFLNHLQIDIFNDGPLNRITDTI